jgi:hypothetical protein
VLQKGSSGGQREKVPDETLVGSVAPILESAPLAADPTLPVELSVVEVPLAPVVPFEV